jgi:hypothetical protein
MAGPPEPREARSEGKLHDPAIQGNILFGGRACARHWMGGSRPPMVRFYFDITVTRPTLVSPAIRLSLGSNTQ